MDIDLVGADVDAFHQTGEQGALAGCEQLRHESNAKPNGIQLLKNANPSRQFTALRTACPVPQRCRLPPEYIAMVVDLGRAWVVISSHPATPRWGAGRGRAPTKSGDGRAFDRPRGTPSSNLVPSSAESANYQFQSRQEEGRGLGRQPDSTPSTAYVTTGSEMVLIRFYVDEVVICCGAETIARHPRSYEREDFVFNPLHYLPLLEQKIGALDQAAPLVGWDLPEEFATLRRLLEARMGKRGKRRVCPGAAAAGGISSRGRAGGCQRGHRPRRNRL
jgi:hypothetical protein